MKTKILSSLLDSTTYEDTYDSIRDFILSSNTSGYITVNNVHTVVKGVLNPDYGRIINEGFMALPDGRPLSVIARWKGFALFIGRLSSNKGVGFLLDA